MPRGKGRRRNNNANLNSSRKKAGGRNQAQSKENETALEEEKKRQSELLRQVQEEERKASDAQRKIKEEEERKKRMERENVLEEERRKRSAQLRLKQEQESRRRKQEEVIARDKRRLEDSRRRNEENLRRQREALERQEQERDSEEQQMYRQLKQQRESLTAGFAKEKAERERKMATLREYEARQVEAPKRRAATQKASKVPTQRPRLIGGSASSGATFEGETALDRQVLRVYNGRAPVDPKLPQVPFSKRTEGLYFLGGRKCEIEEVDGELLVKLGRNTEDLSSWVEKVERVEGLRIRGMSTASHLFCVSQATGVVF